MFLHELGHLQVVDSKAKTERHKFALETRAQDFADFCATAFGQRRLITPIPFTIHRRTPRPASTRLSLPNEENALLRVIRDACNRR